MKKWFTHLLSVGSAATGTRMSASRSFRSQMNVALAVSFGLCAVEAIAAGGLSSATSGLSTFQVWMYSFAGVLALTYLTWKGIEAFTERAHWSDFAIGVGKVAVVGAVLVIGNWAWNLFTS